MRRIAVLLMVLCFLVCGRASAAPGPPYYLVLGDSLGRGIQPLPNGTLVDTNQGYADSGPDIKNDDRATLKGSRYKRRQQMPADVVP